MTDLPLDLATWTAAYADDVFVASGILLLVLVSTIAPRMAAARRRAAAKRDFLEAVSRMNDVLAEAGATGASMTGSRHRGRRGIRIHVWDGEGRTVGGWHPGAPSSEGLAGLLAAAADALLRTAPGPSEDEDLREDAPREGGDARRDGPEAVPERERRGGWWSVLGVRQDATRVEIVAAWKDLARSNHPDLGGSTEEMARVNAARDEALAGTARRR